MNAYYYVSKSPCGYDNLAFDEWLVDNIDPDDFVLYFYVNRNAVIIGKNQNPWKECNLSAIERDKVEIVRRITGGGAVFHDDNNLNFSFITGEKNYSKEKNYAFIIDTLKSFGINAEISGRNDMEIDGRKFSGNAFCKRKNVCQHHGTLLVNSDLGKLNNYLTVDERKIRSKGIDSVRARVINLSEIVPDLTVDSLKDRLIKNFCEKFGASEFVPTKAQAEEIGKYREKHASWEWRIGQTPKFDIEFDERFTWGGVQVLVSLEKGKIVEVNAFSDANDEKISEKIENVLNQINFEPEEIIKAFSNTDNEQLKEVGKTLAERVRGK